jgi:hypothetical protein
VEQPGTPYGAGAPGPAWSQLDEHLWHTCDIVADVIEGRLDRRPLTPTSARIDPGDRVLAVGPGERLTWRGIGNGRYTHTSVVAVGSPGFVFGSVVGNALGNVARRKAAESAAAPRWVVEGAGEVTVTTRKIYLAHPVHWLDLVYSGLSTIDLAAPDIFQTSFHNTNGGGELTVLVRTPWASLLFVMAALAAFPAHPRLLGRGWLPPDFEQRCAALGWPCRPAPALVLNRVAG